MKRLRLVPRTLRTRIAAVFCLLLFLTATVATVVFARQAAHAHLDAQRQLAQYLIAFIEPAVRGMVVSYDTNGLEEYMRKLAGDPAVASIRVIDASGGTLLYDHQGNIEPPSWLQLASEPLAMTCAPLARHRRPGAALSSLPSP